MGFLDWLRGGKAALAEKKEFNLVLMEFYRTKLVYKALEKAKKDPKNAKRQIIKAKRILRKEERTERRLAQGFSRMKEALTGELKTFEETHSRKLIKLTNDVTDLTKQASAFNALLMRASSREGEIEKLLEAAQEDLSRLDDAISKIHSAMSALEGFEIVLKKIKEETLIFDTEVEKELDMEKKIEDITKKLADDLKKIDGIYESSNLPSSSKAGFGSSFIGMLNSIPRAESFETKITYLKNFIRAYKIKDPEDPLYDITRDQLQIQILIKEGQEAILKKVEKFFK